MTIIEDYISAKITERSRKVDRILRNHMTPFEWWIARNISITRLNKEGKTTFVERW